MEKLLNALREALAQLGLDETAIEAALQEAVKKAEGTEEEPQSGDPAEEPTEGDVPPTDVLPPEGSDEVVPSDVPPSADPTTVDVPPTEGDQVPPVEGEVVPPVDPVPPAPAFDPTEMLGQIAELSSKLDEQVKANEGLMSRIAALEEGLKKAGVIEDGNSVTEVGDPNPAAAPTNPTSDVLGDVISKLNGGKKF